MNKRAKPDKTEGNDGFPVNGAAGLRTPPILSFSASGCDPDHYDKIRELLGRAR
jgi:hypothetical protein